jgi:hypothetical protein
MRSRNSRSRWRSATRRGRYREFYGELAERGIGFVNIDQPLFRHSVKPSATATARVGYVPHSRPQLPRVVPQGRGRGGAL